MTSQLDHSFLRSVLSYNPDTGIFTWTKAIGHRRPVGETAGNLGSWGYVRIGVKGTVYAAHRLAWFYVHGEWPENHIDHINGNRTDNSLSNLRLASHAENLRNRGKQKNNTSGFKGVSWHKAARKWVAHIKAGGSMKYLGCFTTAEAAAKAYETASNTMHGEFAKC